MPKHSKNNNNASTKPHPKQHHDDLKLEVEHDTGVNANSNETGITTDTKTSRQKRGSSAVSPVNQVGSDARKKRLQQSPPLAKQQRALPNRGPAPEEITNNRSSNDSSSDSSDTKGNIVDVVSNRTHSEPEMEDGSQDDTNNITSKHAAKKSSCAENTVTVINNISNLSQRLSTLTFEEYNNNEDTREVEEGLNMFMDD